MQLLGSRWFNLIIKYDKLTEKIKMQWNTIMNNSMLKVQKKILFILIISITSIIIISMTPLIKT